jgi:hypothetical protein
MGLKRAIAGLAVGGVAVFAGTASTEDKTVRSDNGEIVDSGGLGVFKVRVGDCVQLPDDDAEFFESLEGVPCGQPHDAETYAEFEVVPLTPDFSRDVVEEMAFNGCLERFAGAMGKTYESAEDLDVFPLYPSKESWAADDRMVTCLVVSVDGSPRVGSDIVS